MKVGDIVNVDPFGFRGMIMYKSGRNLFVQGTHRSAAVDMTSVSVVNPIIAVIWKSQNPKISTAN